jgi:hypothetical protein
MDPPNAGTPEPLVERAFAEAIARARQVPVGRVVVTILVGGWLALLLAAVLGVIGNPAAAASVAALSFVLVLLGISLWDLVLRWTKLPLPSLIGPGPQDWLPALLLILSPWLMLFVGVAAGHFLWK